MSISHAQNDRPLIEFNSETYYLSGYDDGFVSNSQRETYYPKGRGLDNWTRLITREHLFDVTNVKRAIVGLANNYEDYQLPNKQISHDENDEIIMKVTYYSPVHPILIDKKIVIFKKIPNNERVVLYTCIERSFNDPVKNNFKKLQGNKEQHLIGAKYIKLIKELKID